MTTVLIFADTWNFALQNLPSIYQLGSDFVKQLFRIQIQKGKKILLWNQVTSGMEAHNSELILAWFPCHSNRLPSSPTFGHLKWQAFSCAQEPNP